MGHSVSPDLLYGISGFCVGVLVGMTGVGGGSLMTPLLILLFGVHPTTAVGTDLLFAASTKGPAQSSTLLHEQLIGCWSPYLRSAVCRRRSQPWSYSPGSI